MNQATNAPPAATATIRRVDERRAAPATGARALRPPRKEQRRQYAHDPQLREGLHRQAVRLADVLAGAALQEVVRGVIPGSQPAQRARP